MRISIIVCTHNRAMLLNEAIHSLDPITIPEKCDVELILVNNASSDSTASVMESYKKENKRFSVICLYAEKLGKSFALNKGIKAATGSVIAFIDDDHIVTDNYITAVMTTVMKNEQFGIFCGRVFPNWDGSEPEWVHDDVKYPIRPYPVPRFDLGEEVMEVMEEGSYIPGSGNLVVKKSVFDTVGFFSEGIGPKGHNLQGGEDIEFVRRALMKGERLMYTPHIKQLHHVCMENLRLLYLVRKSYLRSLVAYQFYGLQSEIRSDQNIPAYLIRQALTRLFRSAFSINANARRYYCVRFAATIGEIMGRKKALTGPLLKVNG